MRMTFTTSRKVAPLIVATATLSLFALHCSSDDAPPTGTAGSATQPTSGAGGSASQGGSSAGMASGGVTAAGTTTGGSATAGTVGTAGSAGAAGTAGGGGGAGGSAGSGGSAGGSAGSSGSGGGGGGSGVTFAQVKELLAMSCKGSKCHDAGNTGKQVDLTTSDGLYMRLTMPLPAGTAHCVGDTPIVASMPTTSLLVKAVTGPGKISCTKGGGTEMIARMPDDCPTDRMCLTDAQIKLITDWVTAGAKM